MKEGSAEGAMFEAPETPWGMGCAEGCPLPQAEGPGQGAVPLLEMFLFNFWFKMGHFCSKIVCI